MARVFAPAVHEILGTLAKQGLAPAGPVFAHHLRLDPASFDFELGVPVARDVMPAGRVRPGALPERRVARTVYHGAYEGLPAAWGEFESWIRRNGHRPADACLEVYVRGPESDADASTWRTELNRPLDAQE